MIMCMHCALKAYVNDDPPESAVFPNETPEEHLATHHPDMAAVAKERIELEAKADVKLREEVALVQRAMNSWKN